MVQREYVCYSLVQVLRLIQQGLSVKGRDIFVEVGSEKIEIPYPGLESCRVLLNVVMKVPGSLGSEWPNLLVAPCIASNKQNWNTLDLLTVSPRF